VTRRGRIGSSTLLAASLATSLAASLVPAPSPAASLATSLAASLAPAPATPRPRTAAPPAAEPAPAEAVAEPDETAVPDEAAVPEEATVPAPPAPGAVEGLVRHGGRSPLRVKTQTNTVDVEVCGDHVTSQAIVVDPRGALGNVVVELLQADGTRPAEPAWTPTGPPLEVSLAACASQPHVAVIPPGTRIEIANPDHIHHELVTRSVKNVVWESRLPRYRRRVVVPPRSAARPEAVRLGCEKHAFMTAWWWITENERHALTGGDGAFRLPDVAPGHWLVRAWHEELGVAEANVTVEPGAVAHVELIYR
jgi:hypothetical protein